MKNKELVTIADRERVFNNCKELGKDGINNNVINFDKEIAELRKVRNGNNIVTFIPIREDVYKNTMSAYTFVKDPTYNVLYGIPISILPDGNIRWKRIYIEEKMSFNLSNDADCKIYLVMRMHPDVEGSPFQGDSPKYRIYDPELESAKNILKGKLIRNAYAIIDEISGRNLVYFCRNLGVINSHDVNSNKTTLLSKLESFAIADPELFISRYEMANRSLVEIFRSGLELSVIVDKGADGYEYSGIHLGLQESSVILYLKDNPDVNIRLAREIEEKDQLSLSIQKEENSMNKNVKKAVGLPSVNKTGNSSSEDL